MFLFLFENRGQWYPVDGWSYFFFLGLGVFPSLDTIMYLYAYIHIYVAILHVTFCHSYTIITSHWLVVWNIFNFSIYWDNHPNWLSYFSDGLKPPTSTCCWHVPVSVSLSKDWKEVDHQPFAVFPRPGGSVLRSLQIDLEPQITGWYRPTWWFIPRIVSGL